MRERAGLRTRRMIERTTRIPTVGPRGEGWVIIQTIFLVGVAVAGLGGPRWPENLHVSAQVIAIISGAAGLWLAASAIRMPGKSVSPFPKPPATSELKESGVYALVRHPIYGGIVAVPGVVAGTQSLGAHPNRHARRRPRVQVAPRGAVAHRSAPRYAGYRERVRHRFVPRLW